MGADGGDASCPLVSLQQVPLPPSPPGFNAALEGHRREPYEERKCSPTEKREAKLSLFANGTVPTYYTRKTLQTPPAI